MTLGQVAFLFIFQDYVTHRLQIWHRELGYLDVW